MSVAIEDVSDHRVNDTNPPREDTDGLDHQRCAALHNAIVKHGWIASGHLADTSPTSVWWDIQEVAARDAMARRLHASVINFLKAAISPTQRSNGLDASDFFYYLAGFRSAATPHGLLFKEDEEDPDRYLTMYGTTQTVSDKPDGLVYVFRLLSVLRVSTALKSRQITKLIDCVIPRYDQETHTCFLFFNTDEFDPDETLPWQKLESVLSAYIDMIETGKVVALHKELEYPEDLKSVEVPGTDVKHFLPATERPDAMLVDPASGHTRSKVCVGPWMVVPCTERDLTDTLTVWAHLVEAMHSRLTSKGDDNDDAEAHDAEYGLYSDETLNAAGIRDGFARDFLSQELKPRFKYIAPGLRIQSSEEFINQPYGSIPRRSETATRPILLFRGEDNTTPPATLPTIPNGSQVPIGVYLQDCDREAPSPFEDGARLLLPFALGGEDSWARTSDERSLSRSDMLYQIGVNPFISPHAMQLMAILMQWYQCVVDGYWEVDENGVTGGIAKFREAESEEHWVKYFVRMGPSLVF